MIGKCWIIIFMSFLSATFSLSFGPYELIRSDKSVLKLIKGSCESSAECNRDEKCIRILINGTITNTGCVKLKLVQESCSLDIECSLRNRLTTCEHGSCKCKAMTDYDEVTNDCYSGTFCELDANCAPGKTCTASLCLDEKPMCFANSFCQPYEYCADSHCHSAKQVGEQCTRHHECKRWDVHSYCRSGGDRFSISSNNPSRLPIVRENSFCSCKFGYIEDSSTKRCMPKRRKSCSDHNECPPGFDCMERLCFRKTTAPDRVLIEIPTSTTTNSIQPHKVPIYHRASNDTRYYVLIAGVLFMVISLIAGIAGCIRRSREISQVTRRVPIRPTIGMRNGGGNALFNDSNLTPRTHQARQTRESQHPIPPAIDEDAPPSYESAVQSPPSFEVIFGTQTKKQ